MKILITGASKGIGFFLMEKFLKEGHDVYGTYCTTLPNDKYSKYFSQVDVSMFEQVCDWVNSIVNVEDEIVVVNCAGSNYNALAHKSDYSKWKKVIEVNLLGSFGLINAVLPFMRKKGFGRIINFSSIVAQKGISGTSAYAASKSALWGLTKSVAIENAKKGITINNLNLGYFNIGMISDVPEDILNVITKTIPSQKLGEPENIFNAINFLIHNEYLNGTSLDINGGLF